MFIKLLNSGVKSNHQGEFPILLRLMDFMFFQFLASNLARPCMQIGIIWRFMQLTTLRDWHRILRMGLKLLEMFS